MRPSLDNLEASGAGRRAVTRNGDDGAWPVPPLRSVLARRVAELFGLATRAGASAASTVPDCFASVELPEAGQIMLITGPSGAGKSSLLRHLASRGSRRHSVARAVVMDINRAALGKLPCVDQFGGDLERALDLLNRVGLGEAYTYLRTPAELSDGQRWRLRLAVCLGRATKRAQSTSRKPRRTVLIADEFCAVLDRVSAAVVARALRRTINRVHETGVPLAAILATSHDDLAGALLPDTILTCDFGSVTIMNAVAEPRSP